ncbi:MAG: DnaA N-terminal domain-containing protein, partial [Patescibacteria group bacterium]
MDKEQLWQAALGELELSLSKANFTTWFKNTFLAEVSQNHVIIGVPNAFTKTWLENKYHREILKALQHGTGGQVTEVTYRVESTLHLPTKPAAPAAVVAPPTRSSGGTNGFGLNER